MSERVGNCLGCERKCRGWVTMGWAGGFGSCLLYAVAARLRECVMGFGFVEEMGGLRCGGGVWRFVFA